MNRQQINGQHNAVREVNDPANVLAVANRVEGGSDLPVVADGPTQGEQIVPATNRPVDGQVLPINNRPMNITMTIILVFVAVVFIVYSVMEPSSPPPPQAMD